MGSVWPNGPTKPNHIYLVTLFEYFLSYPPCFSYVIYFFPYFASV